MKSTIEPKAPAPASITRQAFLEGVFESVPDAIVTLDTNSNVTGWNKRAEELFGYSSAEAVGKNIDELVATGDPGKRKEAVRFSKQVTSNQTVGPIETVRYHKDGTSLHVILAGSQVLVNGNVEGSVAVYTDITKRVQAEEKFRIVFEFAPDAYYINDLKGRFIDGNQTAEKLIGYKKDELIGKEFWKLGILPKSQIAKATRILAQNALGKSTHPEEITLITKDGKKVDVEIATHPVILGEKSVVLGIARDISFRKLAEADLQRQHNLLTAILEGTPDVIFVKDLEGRYVLSNPTRNRLLGLDTDRVLEITDGDLHPPEISENLKADDHQIIDTGVSVTHEQTIKDKSGEERTFLTSKHPWVDEKGEIIGVIGIAHDITEREQTLQQIAQLKEFNEGIVQNMADGIAVQDLDGNFTFLNPAACQLLGYEAEELIGSHWTMIIPPDQQKTILQVDERRTEGITDHYEVDLVRKDGERLHARVSGSPRFDNQGNFTGTLAVFTDLTDLKKAQQALQTSEKRFRSIFENATIGIYRTTPGGEIQMANPALLRMLGYDSLEELSRRDLNEEGYEPDYPRTVFQNRIEAEGKVIGLESAWVKKDGKSIFIRESARAVKAESGQVLYYEGTVEDITERKQAQTALQENEQFLHSIFDAIQDGISVLDCDFNVIRTNPWMEKMYNDSMPLVGSKCFEVYQKRESPCPWCPTQKTLVTKERQTSVVPYPPGDKPTGWIELSTFPIFDTDGEVINVIEYIKDITQKQLGEQALKESEERYRQRSEDLSLINTINSAVNQGKKLPAITQIFTEEIKRIFDCQTASIILISEDGKYLQTDDLTLSDSKIKQIEKLLGIEIPKVKIPLGMNKFHNKIMREGEAKSVNSASEIQDWMMELANTTQLPDAMRPVIQKLIPQIHKILNINSLISCPILLAGQPLGTLDIAREQPFTKIDVQRIASIAGQLTTAYHRVQSEREIQGYVERIEALLEIDKAITSSLNLDEVLKTIVAELGEVIPYDSVSVQLLKDQKLEILACQGFDKADEVVGLVFPLDAKFPNERVINSQTYLAIEDITQEYPHFREEAEKYESGHIRSWLGVPLLSKGLVKGMIALDRSEIEPFSDIEIQMVTAIANQAVMAIENAHLYQEANSRLARLSSLRHIDQTITSNLDLRTTLDIMLRHVIQQLDVDAAAVLIYQPELQNLQFVAGQGFRTRALQYTDLRLGEGYAGKAALERKTIHFSDLRKLETGFLRSPEFRNEHFVSYVGIPLLAKGNITGVLEIYHRQHLEIDPEWMVFLETLAGQAAIAIDNINLFDNLQKSNMELVQAYDATIEGWAKALELRDMETEGHSRRVVNMTMRLARKLEVPKDNFTHIRRGALLHDIGKMGIPDSLLQKPGKLTDEEWEVMRQHPVLAHRWLSTITYLKPALEIPHCHHEKWDGSGYPQGLEGEQIPIAARIFAVVDVWDALLSDRPYRQAWSKPKVNDYLREQSGIHFDPRVVKAFLELLDASGL